MLQRIPFLARLPLVKRLSQSERGTSIVELGLFLPFLIVLIVSMVDLGMGLSTRMQLQKAVNSTLEMASSRGFSAAEDPQEVDYDFLVPEAAAAAGVEEDAVTLSKWLECDGAAQDEYDSSCGEDETIARYLELRIETTYEPIFDIGVVGSQGSIPLFAEAAVRIQ